MLNYITTYRHIPHNKPEIVIKEKETDMCLTIDVAISSDHNIEKKATEKMTKYVALQIECQRLWHKTVEVIPIIIGATGLAEKNQKSTSIEYKDATMSAIYQDQPS